MEIIRNERYNAQTFVLKNIFKYINRYNTCLLDHILCVEDDTKTNHQERYKDFAINFPKHIADETFSSVTFGKNEYPFLGVSVGDYKANRFFKCSNELDIYFHFVFSNNTTPNSCCSVCDGKIGRKYVECIQNAIVEMFKFNIKITNGGEEMIETTNLFDYLNCKTDEISNDVWNYNVRAVVSDDISVSETVGREDQLNEFIIKVPLVIRSLSKTCDCSDEQISCCD